MSEPMVFCFLMCSFRCSTVLMISCGTCDSFAFVLSFLPSTDLGALALMSTPPRPTVVVVDVAGAAATVAVVVDLAAPNKPPPAVLPKPSVLVPPVVAVAAVPKLSVGTANVDVVVAVAVVPADTLSPPKGLAELVEVVPSPNDSGAAAVVVVGLPKLNPGNAVAVVVVAAVAAPVPKENPVAAVGLTGAMEAMLVVAAGVPNENAGADVVGVPKEKPDIVAAKFLYAVRAGTQHKHGKFGNYPKNE